MNQFEAYYKSEVKKADSKLYEDLIFTQIKNNGLNLPQREFVFLEGRKFRFDFAWPELRLALEVEGGTWTNGRHTRGYGFENDCIKYDEAALAGWCVIRVTPNMIKDSRAINLIKRALANGKHYQT